MRILWITAVTIIVDQIAKVAVVKYMFPGQSIPVLGDWLRLTFTTNPGMAFGITFGPPGFVTILSLLATGLIVGYIYTVRGGYAPYLASLGLILGGALGNIIDRVIYGVIYENGPLFTGEVVDFIHFNIWRGYLPEQVPLLGGNYVALFPIWNVADMAIVIGVVGILLFQGRFHEKQARRQTADDSVSEAGQNGVAGESTPAVEPIGTEGYVVENDSNVDGSAVIYSSPTQGSVLGDRDRSE
jgi:signal peptidase II